MSPNHPAAHHVVHHLHPSARACSQYPTPRSDNVSLERRRQHALREDQDMSRIDWSASSKSRAENQTTTSPEGSAVKSRVHLTTGVSRLAPSSRKCQVMLLLAAAMTSSLALTGATGAATPQAVETSQVSLSQVRFRSIKIYGLEIAFRETGDPKKPKLVLLHGLSSNLVPTIYAPCT